MKKLTHKEEVSLQMKAEMLVLADNPRLYGKVIEGFSLLGAVLGILTAMLLYDFNLQTYLPFIGLALSIMTLAYLLPFYRVSMKKYSELKKEALNDKEKRV